MQSCWLQAIWLLQEVDMSYNEHAKLPVYDQALEKMPQYKMDHCRPEKCEVLSCKTFGREFNQLVKHLSAIQCMTRKDYDDYFKQQNDDIKIPQVMKNLRWEKFFQRTMRNIWNKSNRKRRDCNMYRECWA